jgi:thymidylate synthase (FAD)
MLTLNARSLMHILDLRWKKDAQPEIQQLSELLFYHFQNWMPEIAQYYYDKRAKKAKLSP